MTLSQERDLLGDTRHLPWELRELLGLPALPVRVMMFGVSALRGPDMRSEVLRRLKVGELDEATAAAVVPRLWLQLAPRPLDHVSEALWRRLFAVAGYTEEGLPAAPEPVQLFRGGSATGWSWTDSRRFAVAFATDMGTVAADCGKLWTTLAPPEALCARVPAVVDLNTGRSLADEYVVDPGRLQAVRTWTAEEIEATPCPRVESNGLTLTIVL